MSGVFGLSRPPAGPALFGLPSAVPPILPTQMRQAVTATSGNSLTLPSLPAVGSLLFAHASANSSGVSSSSCSGGGVVTWNLLVAHGAGGTNNTAHVVYWGIVGATPSNVITIQLNGGGGIMGQAAEFRNLVGGLSAEVDGVRNTAAAGTLVLPTLRSAVRRGVVIAAISGMSITGYPGGLTTAISTSTTRTSAILYGAAAYPANTDLALAIATSANATGCAIVIE